jgi:hypothetical protein
MGENRGKDIIFALFMLTVLILAVLYFSASKRVIFMTNEIEWWAEFWDVFKTLGI